MRRILLILSILLTALGSMAQRTVTPVETDDKKPQAPTLHYYDKHGKPLDEPVLFLATLDTVSSTKTTAKPVYPKLSEINVGINFFDGIMAAAGSHYGGADVWANVGLWNWLFPTVELGIGSARKTPDGNNYTYKGWPAFYAKIGADYNFLYKSNPQYQLFVGLRCGFSSFRYSLEDVTFRNDYWQQTQTESFNSLSSTAVYGEALLGLKVNLWKNLSMGWSARYRFMFSNPPTRMKADSGAPFGGEFHPWYIPGYGPRTSHFGFTFSLIYTLPFHTAKTPPEPQPLNS